MSGVALLEKGCKERDHLGCDDYHPAAGHALFNSLRFGSGIVIPVPFKQVYHSPDR